MPTLPLTCDEYPEPAVVEDDVPPVDPEVSYTVETPEKTPVLWLHCTGIP